MPIDRIPFFQDEQYVSADLNSLQRMAERYIEDVAAYAQRSSGLSRVGSSPSNDSDQPKVALVGGLTAFPSGAGLEVGPGMLLSTQVTAPDNPTLSGAYLCTNPAATVVALPTPVSDTWCVICARPQLGDDAPVARRKWNPGLDHWDPVNLVKRQRSSILFDVVVSPFAGQLPFVYPTNAVPIWAVLRPAGGGAVLDDHVIDLRPIRPLGGARSDGIGTGVALGHSAWAFTAAGLLQLNVHVALDNTDLHAVTTGAGLDPLLFKNPSDPAPADGEWWYLYLARFPYLGPNCAPRHAQLGAALLAQQGLVVLSKVAPYAGDYGLARVNANDLHAPDPFSGAVIGSGHAALFGALKRVGSSWQPCQGDADRVTMLGFVSGTDHAATHVFNFDHGAPLGARAVTLEIDSSAAATVYELDRPDGTVSLYYRNLPAVAERRTEVEVPLGPLGTSTTVRFRSTEDGTWTPKMRGYRI